MVGSFNSDFGGDFDNERPSGGSFNVDFSDDFKLTREEKVLHFKPSWVNHYFFTPRFVSDTVVNATVNTATATFHAPEVEAVPYHSINLPVSTATAVFHSGTHTENVFIEVPVSTATVLQSTASVFILKVIKWTGEAIPSEHVEDSKELEMDAYVDLFEITLADKVSKIYMKDNNTVTWRGNKYEGTGIKLTGVASYADDQVSRPELSLFNPNGVYSYLVDKELLDNARISRIRLLKQHLDGDIPVFRKQSWRVSRISSLRKDSIKLQLRDSLDGQFFLTPARMFIPPEFPQVSLN